MNQIIIKLHFRKIGDNENYYTNFHSEFHYTNCKNLSSRLHNYIPWYLNCNNPLISHIEQCNYSKFKFKFKNERKESRLRTFLRIRIWRAVLSSLLVLVLASITRSRGRWVIAATDLRRQPWPSCCCLVLTQDVCRKDNVTELQDISSILSTVSGEK